MSTINVGQFNLMRVDRKVDFGFYMDDGGEGILLPKSVLCLQVYK